MWKLNGNGLSYLTTAEQARVTSSTNINLKFVSGGHGLVASDGENHLYAGERIIADWVDPASIPAPSPAPLAGTTAVSTTAVSTTPGSDVTLADIEAAVDRGVDRAITRIFHRFTGED